MHEVHHSSQALLQLQNPTEEVEQNLDVDLLSLLLFKQLYMHS